MAMGKESFKREISDGKKEGFESLSPLDLKKISDADEMLKGMAKTAFAGRSLGEAAEILYEMATDPECFVVGTFSGAMTPAQMGLVLSEMIDQGLLQAVVSTGALMTHGLVMTAGMTHFKHDFSYPDDYLCQKGYNRIYDTIELEKNLDDLELIGSASQFDAPLNLVPSDGPDVDTTSDAPLDLTNEVLRLAVMNVTVTQMKAGGVEFFED